MDSYATLLVLLLANFLLLELVDDPRWGAIGSTALSAVALVTLVARLVTLWVRQSGADDAGAR